MTGTSSPSAHSSFSTVPDAVLGTSVAALSVSTSQRMPFSAMVSPSIDRPGHDETGLDAVPEGRHDHDGCHSVSPRRCERGCVP